MRTSSALLTMLVMVGATRPAAHAVGPVVQHTMEVIVEADGNGLAAARFPTTVEGELVRYALVIENGCRLDRPRCKYPLPDVVTVTLNEDVVLERTGPDDRERVEVALVPVGSDPNEIVVQASGLPGASARLVVAALEPGPQRLGGRSVLPHGDADTALAVHNVGPAPIAYRLVFHFPDGTVAGRTPARLLGRQARDLVDLGPAAAGLGWTAGAVHVWWGSLGDTRVSATTRELALDDYGPFPLNRIDFDDVTGGLLP